MKKPDANLRMSLSGGMATKAWYESIYQICDTEKPRIVIDSSARVGKKLYNLARERSSELFARYELPDPLWLQTEADGLIDKHRLAEGLRGCDAFMVLGGSTYDLYERWRNAEIDQHITQAVRSGTIAAVGASAGAMIWFEQGCSDSDMFNVPEGSQWEYRDVAGLGLLPGLVTAHYSDTDELGRRRADVYADYLSSINTGRRVALGIDTSAAAVIQNGILTVKDVNAIDEADPANIHIFTSGAKKRQILVPGDSTPLQDIFGR